jgi:hypothetical protein
MDQHALTIKELLNEIFDDFNNQQSDGQPGIRNGSQAPGDARRITHPG